MARSDRSLFVPSGSKVRLPLQVKWLFDTGEKLRGANGCEISIWELRHESDDRVLSDWARHFRGHYCADNKIDILRDGTGHSRSEYLNALKFPDTAVAPGPSIRAGDFAEILIADYVEYLLGFWVPRTRYADKTVRNESTKGSDVIGFKVVSAGRESADDMLLVFEIKAKLSGDSPSGRLQDAVDDSAKDLRRRAESLNAIKQRLVAEGGSHSLGQAKRVARFQDVVARPYKEQFGAAAVISSDVFDRNIIKLTGVGGHPAKGGVQLLVVHGVNLMSLVHELYKRAADEA
ncbi:DUF1837 domain-containing protein [Corallococcus exiguus]|uniref:Hachiman antiphage defense system protein HamA n=1 Tax=Corallococcus exiguus TaxID=83462 RepID=UPI001472380D|nr:Hachiman antiphage defense system protein HamA [Corallococcus exiguus]NNB94283.1 DUF1837 domain-containing protein [Corallococcus exiguus]NNC02920.1 DUF1837 domain-containing protein [Corallococcus exiguus]